MWPKHIKHYPYLKFLPAMGGNPGFLATYLLNNKRVQVIKDFNS